jgi:predicted amidohydrolase YtcJ
MAASLVILNANLITLDPSKPRASAVAVQNNRIVAVGSEGEVRKHVGNETRVLDLKRRTVVPGLIDCHVHMAEFGFSLGNPDLRDAKSTEEMQQKLREHARRNRGKGWILGGRWNHEKFREKRYPTRWDLDFAVADRPVFLVRVCGHVGVANSEALRLADIKRESVVRGGRIGLDEHTREPDGIVVGNAMNLVWRVVPKPTPTMVREACKLACEKAVEVGLTCVHWLVDSLDELEAVRKLNAEGKLPLRAYLCVLPKLLDQLAEEGLSAGSENGMVKVGFVKLLADGSLGARTAALEESYSDRSGSRGIMLLPQTKLSQLTLRAHKAGFQIGTHAIGDRAIKSVLQAYKGALDAFPRKNPRHRIEHCSVLDPLLIREMGSLGLVASVQPLFTVSDYWVVDRLGKERARWVYPFKTLTEEGVIISSGSDCPVEDISPLLGLWAAVTRKDSKQERLTVDEALKTYTLNAAFASFDEDKRGTIEVGKLADFTVLSDDPFAVEPDEIRDITVEMTVVDGTVVYERSGP